MKNKSVQVSLSNNVHKKLRVYDWLTTSAFSCNTSAKL